MTRTLIALQVVVILLCWSASPALAANPDTGPGCGLGKLVWSGYEHQKNIAPQVMMATTNTTWTLFFTQTFAISSGTSGCTNDGTVMAQYKAPLFVEVNDESLSQEMAQGGGEHLASLATLLGVPAEQQPEFFAMTQERYRTLTEAGQASPVAMIQALHEAMAAHPVLAKVSTTR